MLGEDVEIDIVALDETNTRIRPERIAGELARNGGFGMVAFVGVQSNQYPHAMDIARKLRAGGAQVAIGGFHVSGCLAMLPQMPDDLKEAQALGISLFAGEAEDRLELVLRDAATGTLQPLYDFMNDLPSIEAAPTPFLPVERVERTGGRVTSFDAGRGCPFQCSFCTIINVQGRKSRYRTPDDVEAIVRANLAQGVRAFFITDDNLARNKNWEPIFDRLIEVRADTGVNFSIVIQVDTLCHRIPNFIEKAAKAGVRRVFLGLENINPDNLIAAKKKQNRIAEYRTMLLAWKAVGCFTYAGYILGFPNDTAGLDHPRHRDHPARAAARSSGILLPDAAAGLGGSPETAQGRHPDGPGHEQIRSRACDDRPIRKCRRPNGRASTGRPGRPITRPSIWKPSCAALMRPASARAR